MGEKSEGAVTLYMDGQPLGDLKEIPELTAPEDSDYEPFTLDLNKPTTITGTLILPSCKTRKRFVKLVMARGYSKREAEIYARILVRCFGSYRLAWLWFVLVMPDLS